MHIYQEKNNDFWRNGLTCGEGVEFVVVDLVVRAAEREADAVLAVLEHVVVDVGVVRLHEGHTGVLHVVHVVVWTRVGGGRRVDGQSRADKAHKDGQIAGRWKEEGLN